MTITQRTVPISGAGIAGATVAHWLHRYGFVPTIFERSPALSLYLDRIAQVRLPSWSRGRIAVVGDAPYCATPISGMGASLALIGAYLLAGELAAHPDHAKGFAEYERRMGPIVDEAQKLPPGVPGLANPTSRLGVRIFRTVVRLAGSRPGRAVTSRLVSSSEDSAPSLPDYADRAAWR